MQLVSPLTVSLSRSHPDSQTTRVRSTIGEKSVLAYSKRKGITVKHYIFAASNFRDFGM